MASAVSYTHLPGPAALFGLPPAGRALLYAALQKDLGRLVCIVTPGEAEATHFADAVSYTHLDVYKRQMLGCMKTTLEESFRAR